MSGRTGTAGLGQISVCRRGQVVGVLRPARASLPRPGTVEAPSVRRVAVAVTHKVLRGRRVHLDSARPRSLQREYIVAHLYSFMGIADAR